MTNCKLKVLLLFAISLSQTVLAQTVVEEPVQGLAVGAQASKKSEVSRMDGVLNLLTQTIPAEKLRCAIGKIQETINPSAYGDDASVGFKNNGITTYISNYAASNPCFDSVASSFWEKILKENSADKNVSDSQELSDRESARRPTIEERAGAGRFSAYPQGWLWKRSILATQGDAHAAAMLVAMCTHDDTSLTFKVPADPKVEKHRMQLELESASDEINKLRLELSRRSSDSPEYQMFSNETSRLSKLQLKLEEALKSGKITSKNSVACPSGASPALVPGAIDASVDINPDLKSEIIALQKPAGTSNEIPAKAYHFVGGLLVGCELARCGLSPNQASDAAGLLANGYRALRICSQVRGLIDEQTKLLSLLQDVYRVDSPDFTMNARNFLVEKLVRGENLRGIMGSGIASIKLKQISSQVENPVQREILNLEQKESAEKIVNARLAEEDSARLFDRWYMGSSGVCTTIRLGGPKSLIAKDVTQMPDPNTGQKHGGTLCDIPGWSLERCEKARKKLATWDADFKWTAAQHRIGARFGAEQCKLGTKEALQNDDKLCPSVDSSRPAEVINGSPRSSSK